MLDVNSIVEPMLVKAGVSVCFRYPQEFTDIPCISFYNLSDTEGFRADCTEWAQLTRVQVDIWAEHATETNSVGIKVNEIMQADGWRREYAADMPKQDGKLEHRTMRFAKEIYF